MVRSRLRSLLVEQLAGNPALIGSPFVGWMKASYNFDTFSKFVRRAKNAPLLP